MPKNEKTETPATPAPAAKKKAAEEPSSIDQDIWGDDADDDEE